MAEKYVKLGEKANSFYDPSTGLSLVPNEVKEVPGSFLRSQRTRRFLKGGGIAYASKEEFNEYQAKLKPQVKKLAGDPGEPKGITKTPEPSIDLGELTKAGLIEHIEEQGWDEEDVAKAKAIKKKADLIEFIQDTEAQYE